MIMIIIDIIIIIYIILQTKPCWLCMCNHNILHEFLIRCVWKKENLNCLVCFFFPQDTLSSEDMEISPTQLLALSASLQPSRQPHWTCPSALGTHVCSHPPFLSLQDVASEHVKNKEILENLLAFKRRQWKEWKEMKSASAPFNGNIYIYTHTQ